MSRENTISIPVQCRIDDSLTNTIPVNKEYRMELDITLSKCEPKPYDQWIFVLEYSEGLWDIGSSLDIETSDVELSGKKRVTVIADTGRATCTYDDPGAEKVKIKIRRLMTQKEAGEAWLDLKVYPDNVEEECAGECRLVFEKQTALVEILDFYPADGAVSAGAGTELRWELSGELKDGIQLKLYEGEEGKEKEIALDPKVQSKKIENIKQTTAYTLKLTGQEGEKEDKKKTKIQVLPLYLKTFEPSSDSSGAVIEVCCAERVRLDGMEFPFSRGELTEDWSGESMYLEAGSGQDWVRARLYASTEDEQNIALFRKTITCSRGMTLLNVASENLVLAGERKPRAVAGKALTLIDKKHGTETVFYVCNDEKDKNRQEWEMILEGYSGESVDKEIQIKMDVKEKSGKIITIIL